MARSWTVVLYTRLRNELRAAQSGIVFHGQMVNLGCMDLVAMVNNLYAGSVQIVPIISLVSYTVL